jgi:hypothetical protein
VRPHADRDPVGRGSRSGASATRARPSSSSST